MFFDPSPGASAVSDQGIPERLSSFLILAP
jgi:hypothetical protein